MDGTRWLDQHEQQVWREFLEVTQLLWDRLGRELDAVEGGLSLSEYELLARLSDAEGRSARMSTLAGQLVHSRSRLTHTVSRLEDRGLVRREVCLNDRRGVLAVLTDNGHEALAAAAPTHVTGVREHLFDQLDPEQVAALGEAMARVGRHLREG